MRRRPRREVRTQRRTARRIGTARAADRRPSPGGGREYAEQAAGAGEEVFFRLKIKKNRPFISN